MTINFDTLKASLILYGLNAIYAILLLAVGWYLSGAMHRFVARVLSVAHRVDPLVTLFVGSLARYGVLAVVGIAVLQLFGIQTASLVAVLGATSLAIGLALQGTLSNIAAGVMLLLFRPFHIGDDVEVAGKAGKVQCGPHVYSPLNVMDRPFRLSRLPDDRFRIVRIQAVRVEPPHPAGHHRIGIGRQDFPQHVDVFFLTELESRVRSVNRCPKANDS